MPNLCDQIPNLSTAEKRVAMEALWISLHQTFEDSAPPDWHREILNRSIPETFDRTDPSRDAHTR
jgi:hypothetical protein